MRALGASLVLLRWLGQLLGGESLYKTPKVGGSESFRVGEHIHSRRVTHPNPTGTEALVVRTLPDLFLCISSSGCSQKGMVCLSIPFNKLANVFPWVLWAALANSANPRGSWEPLICSKLRQVFWITCGPLACNWHLKWEEQSFGTDPLQSLGQILWDLTLSRWTVSELS